MVQSWALRFSHVALVLIGAGPPCQGVSGLNAGRKGALRDERSFLFSHVARVRDLVRLCFPWGQVQGLMENVASMDAADEKVMSESFGARCWYIDAAGVSIAHRPRLYWVDWELLATEDAAFGITSVGRQCVTLKADVQVSTFLTPGWEEVKLATSHLSPLVGLGINLATSRQEFINVQMRKKSAGKQIALGFPHINIRISTVYRTARKGPIL